MLKYDINNTKFVTTGNKKSLSNTDTVFRYFLKDNIITGHYSGGSIVDGQMTKVGNENKYSYCSNANHDDELLLVVDRNR